MILSPVIGLIIALVSKNVEDEKNKKELLNVQKETVISLNKNLKNDPQSSILDNLTKLKKLKDDGVITDAEFNDLKAKIMDGKDTSLKELKSKSDVHIVSVNGFSISISDIDVPNEIKNELNIDSKTLEYQIKENERYMKFYKLRNYPFIAALELDKREVKIPSNLLDKLKNIAKTEFQVDSINEVLIKM